MKILSKHHSAAKLIASGANNTDTAKALECHRYTIINWRKQPEFLDLIEKYRQSETPEPSPHADRGNTSITSSVEDISASKAKKEFFDARLKEIEVHKAEGKLLESADVLKVWTEYVSTIRSKLLAIPDRAAPEVIGITDAAEARDFLTALIHETLIGLRDLQPEDFAPDKKPGQKRKSKKAA